MPSELPDPTAQDTHHENADGLLPFVPIATRAMFGLSEEQAVLDAAMGALSQSACAAAVLRARDGEVRLASASIGESMMRAIEAFVGPTQVGASLPLSTLTRIRRVVEDELTVSTSVPDICKEIFPENAAGKVASLLGGADSFCLGAPIRSGGHVGGVLLVIEHRQHVDDLAATTQLAESIGVALSFAQVLDAVKRARSELGTDHPAQHYLGAALRSVGVLAPEAPRSLAPGGGKFETLRPRLKDDTFSMLPSPGPESDPDNPRARILLVEDEARVRKSTIALLGGLGYAVEGTESGERAIALYTTAKDQRRAFDLVLLDQTLIGQMGGVETLRILRSLDPGVRAILLSGQADRESPEEMVKHGFLATINKPVALDTLNAAIESALL